MARETQGRQPLVQRSRDQHLQQANLSELRELGRREGVTGAARMTKAKLVERLMKTGDPSLPAEEPLRRAAAGEDRLHVEGVNHRWLRVSWALTPRTLERAVSAMGMDWRRSSPVLRLHRIVCDDSGPRCQEHVEDIVLPGDTSEWYVNVPQVGESWQVEIGYLARNGRYFSLLHSVAVEPPKPRLMTGGACKAGEGELTERPQENRREPLTLQVRGEILLYGASLPDAEVTVDDVPVPLHPETGEFQWKCPLIPGRLVVPVVASTRMHNQRVLLSVESHFRYMEREQRDEE